MTLQRRRMKMKVRQYVKSLILLWTLTNAVEGQQSCFDTLGAINTVMQTELIRIQNGATPQDSYTYNLCPNKIFDAASVFLEPVLNNVNFVCGNDGMRSNSCVIVGGTTQVRIEDSDVTGYTIEQISFTGITFSRFQTSNTGSGTSIAAFASSATTATFTDCEWKEFTSDFVILQKADNEFSPMSVQVSRSSLIGGTSGSIFSNDGGLLRINQLEVTDVTAAALVATANNGASFLDESTITSSSLDSITYTTAGGSQSVKGTSAARMNFMDDAFFVEGDGSTLLLDGLVVEQNTAQSTPWSAIAVRRKAIARITGSNIANNKALEFGIVVFDSTTIVQDSQISQNTGSVPSNATSAPIFAITDASVTLERVELNSNTDFSGAVIALIRSSVQIKQSCFRGGSSTYVVFIANDASFDVSNNYLENFTSQQCVASGPRLFKENAGSGCFTGSSTCEGTCLVLDDATECLAQDVPTATPNTLAPSVAPTTKMPSLTVNPTIAPTTRMPSLNPTTAPATTAPSRGPTTTPTLAPSTSVPTLAPTTNATLSPSISAAPSSSFAPSSKPSASLQPTMTISDAPSFAPSIIETLPPVKTPAPTDINKHPKGGKGSKNNNKSGTSVKGKGKGKGMDGSKQAKGGKGPKGKGPNDESFSSSATPSLSPTTLSTSTPSAFSTIYHAKGKENLFQMMKTSKNMGSFRGKVVVTKDSRGVDVKIVNERRKNHLQLVKAILTMGKENHDADVRGDFTSSPLDTRIPRKPNVFYLGSDGVHVADETDKNGSWRQRRRLSGNKDPQR